MSQATTGACRARTAAGVLRLRDENPVPRDRFNKGVNLLQRVFVLAVAVIACAAAVPVGATARALTDQAAPSSQDGFAVSEPLADFLFSDATTPAVPLGVPPPPGDGCTATCEWRVICTHIGDFVYERHKEQWCRDASCNWRYVGSCCSQTLFWGC